MFAHIQVFPVFSHTMPSNLCKEDLGFCMQWIFTVPHQHSEPWRIKPSGLSLKARRSAAGWYHFHGQLSSTTTTHSFPLLRGKRTENTMENCSRVGIRRDLLCFETHGLQGNNLLHQGPLHRGTSGTSCTFCTDLGVFSLGGSTVPLLSVVKDEIEDLEDEMRNYNTASAKNLVILISASQLSHDSRVNPATKLFENNLP